MADFERDLAVQSWINQHWNWDDSDVRNTESLLEILQELKESHRQPCFAVKRDADADLLQNMLFTRIETMREIAYRRLKEPAANLRYVAVYRHRNGIGTAGVFFLPPSMDASLIIDIDGKTAAIARSWVEVERYLGCGLGGLGFVRLH